MITSELLESTLTKQQSEHFKTLSWLFGPGPRGTGRTYVLAVMTIKVAMANPNILIRCMAHNLCHDRSSESDTLDEILKLRLELELPITYYVSDNLYIKFNQND